MGQGVQRGDDGKMLLTKEGALVPLCHVTLGSSSLQAALAELPQGWQVT